MAFFFLLAESCRVCEFTVENININSYSEILETVIPCQPWSVLVHLFSVWTNPDDPMVPDSAESSRLGCNRKQSPNLSGLQKQERIIHFMPHVHTHVSHARHSRTQAERGVYSCGRGKEIRQIVPYSENFSQGVTRTMPYTFHWSEQTVWPVLTFMR